MQKKSLLVALFCGALCLTGCLKNEESASVAQVRIAKANELNSIAKLNEAKAAAEAVYAQAELTVANAEAKLREANAALVMAQAETEKVRAELLKVRVALAEVKVDEEKVRLQMLEADLQQKLAEVEAAVAMAEAEKQGWINVLNHALADAERQAIEDAQAILEAEQALEAAVLKMEKAQADSAKAASIKYFAALDEVQNLQKEQIETKAMKALVEAGAIEVRDAIHEQIDKIDEKIVEKEALVKYLKKYQTMTPEEAEEALKAARTALNEAYNKYKDAIENTTKAKGVLDDLTAMKADFNNNDRQNPQGSQWYRDFKNEISAEFGDLYKAVTDQEVTYGEGESAITQVGLKVEGLDLRDIEGVEVFVPFWQSQDSTVIPSRYPNIDVVAEGAKKNYVELKTTLYAPATIYYDNIEGALKTKVLVYGTELAAAVVDFEEELNDKAEGYEGVEGHVDGWKKQIATNEEKLALHQAYVDAREAIVAEAEAAYVAELGKEKAAETAKEEAWEAFQNYILINHNETRDLFRLRYAADTAYQGAVRDTAIASFEYNQVKLAVPTLEDITPIFEQFVAAEGAYNHAVAMSKAPEAGTLAAACSTARARFNPDFEAALAANGKPVVDPATEPNKNDNGYYYQGRSGNRLAHWIIMVDGVKVEAGTIQDSVQTWMHNLDLANEKLYIARQNNVRYPDGMELPAGVTADRDTTKPKDNITKWTKELDTESTGINARHSQAKITYWDRLGDYEMFVYGGKTAAEASSKKASIEAAYNPEFNNNKITDLVQFPTPGKPDAKFALAAQPWDYRYQRNDDGEWVRQGNGEVAGTAQGALIDAVFAAVNIIRQTERGYTGRGRNNPTAYQKYLDAMDDFEEAEEELLERNIELMEAHGADFTGMTDKEKAEYVEEHLSEYLDTKADELYAAYKAVTNEAKVNEALTALIDAYSYTPDEIGPFVPGWGGHKSDPDENVYDDSNWKQSPFGWVKSSYMVDYEAKVLDLETGEPKLAADVLYDKIPAQEVDVKVEYTESNTPILPTNAKFSVKVTKSYVDADGKKVTSEDAAAQIPDFTQSLTFQNEVLQAKVDAIEDLAADASAQAEKLVEAKQKKAEELMALLNKYKATEAGYKAWLKNRQTAEKNYNKALMDQFDAQQVENDAQAKYDAAQAVVDEGMWVYDNDGKVWAEVKDLPGAQQDGKFTFVPITKAIENIEGEVKSLSTGVSALFTIAIAAQTEYDTAFENQELTIAEIQHAYNELNGKDQSLPNGSIAELNFTKNVLEQALKYGKVALQVVVDAFDAEIAELDEKIEVYTKIAEIYKAIMNAYLGIVDEADVEGETGPLDGEGEGDDEE